ncbi:SPT2 chromatin protein-domain-containing protein [Umbelopsis sp. PMI_123]|nr:SPT2 chromatin protein-domain-containing protein [Umbelopsis sp. PMI_123]
MSDVQFEDLLAAATRISREHEQDLQQRADRAREAETRKRQEEERRQKSKRDAQAAIVKLREEEEKRRKKAFQKQKLLKERREQELLQRQKQQQRNSTERKPADRKPTDRKPITKQPVRQNIALEKPKVVQDLSFDEIMKRAKQVPTDKKSLIMQKKPPPPVPTYNRAKPSVSEVNGKPMPKAPSSTPNKAHATPSKLSNKASIYTSRPSSSTSTAVAGTQMGSVRDRLKNIALAPPQRLNTVKRDLRSVEEIQQDVRRQLGKSANEDRPARDRVRERQPIRRSLSPRSASARDRAPDRRPIGRSLSPRPIPRQQRPPGHMPFRPNRARRYSDEDEDDDLDGFIDDGDVEEDNNNYSDVISKMFRYDRKRYRDEAYSDDDMEAGASDVLREESRSTRIARQEDLLEEQREREEMERAHKRKLARQKMKQQ